MQRLNRLSQGAVGSRLTALTAGVAVGALAFAAWAGQLAQSPSAQNVPALASTGPGKLGLLRAFKLGDNGEIPVGIAAAGRRALPDSPLAYEPFFAVAAEDFRNKSDTGNARDGLLLREALRRNPRSREARMLLMRHAVGSGDLREAIDQLAALNRLNGIIVDQLMAALGNGISSVRQVDEAVAALAPHRQLYNPFIRGFALARKPAPLVVRLISQLPPAALADPTVRAIAIDQMVQAEAFTTARTLWAGGRRRGTGELVYSPDFSDWRAPPPFNWQLEQSATGVTERGQGGRLMVEFYGRESGLLASQLLTLAPGNYAAVLDYRTESGTAGGIVLQVRCAAGGAVLGQIPLRAGVGTGQKLSLGFAVPTAGCGGQILGLAGMPLEDRKSQVISARLLSVVRAGQP